MFDISGMVKELQESIDIKDDPKTLDIDLLMKGPPKGNATDGPSPMPQLQDKDGFLQLCQMAGVQPPEQDFDFEQIEGGTRLKFKNKKDKTSMKQVLTQLFKGDLLKKVFEQLIAAFNGMGRAFEDIGKKMGEPGKIEE